MSSYSNSTREGALDGSSAVALAMQSRTVQMCSTGCAQKRAAADLAYLLHSLSEGSKNFYCLNQENKQYNQYREALHFISIKCIYLHCQFPICQSKQLKTASEVNGVEAERNWRKELEVTMTGREVVRNHT